MQIYDCKVRHAGNLFHEIPKFGVTAPEIMILRSIHGGDAVTGIQARKNDRRPHREEIERLKAVYGEKAFTAVFGNGHIEKLPQKLDGVALEEESSDTPDKDDE